MLVRGHILSGPRHTLRHILLSGVLLCLACILVFLASAAGAGASVSGAWSAGPEGRISAPGGQFTATATPTCPPIGGRTVVIENSTFIQANVTVTLGSTVTWWNYDGGIPHTSTSDSGEWSSGNLSGGQSFGFTFTNGGTYPYHCDIHPAMHGSVTVVGGCSPKPTVTPGCTLDWAIVSSPDVGSDDNHLLDIAAVATNDIWAVGYYYNGFASQTLVEHWNGTSWTVVPSPNVGNGTTVLHGVTAVSANDVWAVGYTGTQTVTEHWNGTQWSIVGSPNVGTGANGLNGVAVVAANDIWAVGHYFQGSSNAYRTLIEHWNGGGWSVVSSPNVGTDSNFLWGGVAPVSASDIWAVGSYGPVGSRSTLALHWNGTTWSVVPTPNAGTTESWLNGVAALAPNDVWAVGYYSTVQGERTLIEHWNGSAWSIVYSPNPSG
ncbi:MAG: plastocyanin/azurin family copper-binding protein, partial [Chloroflexia bacterium]